MGYKIEVEVPPLILEEVGAAQIPNEIEINSVSWRYQYYDIGIPTAKRVPIKPIKVSLGNFLVDAEQAPASPLNQKVSGFLDYKITNTNIANNHKLAVEIFLNASPITKSPVIVLAKRNYPIVKKMKADNPCDCPLDLLLSSGCQDPNHI